MMNRFLAIILSVTVVAGLLTGCGAGDSAVSGPIEREGDSGAQSVFDSDALAGGDTAEASPDELSAAEGEESGPDETESDWPRFDWELDVPENQGMDSELLAAMHDALQGTEIYTAVTVRHGVVVDEFYQDGYDETSIFRMNSCSKSFTSALIGIAIEEGLIEGVDVAISEFFAETIGTEKEGITIRHLLEHTSGIAWEEFGGSATSFYALNDSDNWVDYVLDRPMAATPGSTFIYSTGGTHLLAAILEQVTDESLMDYAASHLFEPLAMDSVQWRADPQGILDGGNGIEMTARDAAKFGQLFLENGNWAGRQLVPEEWVQASTGVQVARDGNYGSYGYQWWIRPFGAARYDTFYAMGAMGQFILVVPELELVSVFASSMSGDTTAPYDYISDHILAACDNRE